MQLQVFLAVTLLLFSQVSSSEPRSLSLDVLAEAMTHWDIKKDGRLMSLFISALNLSGEQDHRNHGGPPLDVLALHPRYKEEALAVESNLMKGFPWFPYSSLPQELWRERRPDPRCFFYEAVKSWYAIAKAALEARGERWPSFAKRFRHWQCRPFALKLRLWVHEPRVKNRDTVKFFEFEMEFLTALETCNKYGVGPALMY
jgi:hypothetical protein